MNVVDHDNRFFFFRLSCFFSLFLFRTALLWGHLGAICLLFDPPFCMFWLKIVRFMADTN